MAVEKATPVKPKRHRRTKAQMEADRLAEDKRREELATARAAAIPAPVVPKFSKIFHIVNDGHTVFGQTRYRGEEFLVEEGTSEFELAFDRNGNFVFGKDENEQIEAYGEVKYREGPWPGLPYDTNIVYEEGLLTEDKKKLTPTEQEIQTLIKVNKQRKLVS